MTVPALPPLNSNDWYTHYAAIDAAVRQVGANPALTLQASAVGDTLTGWDLNGTTWSLNTHLQVVSTSAAWRTARYDAVPIAPAQDWAFEGEVEFQADMTGTADFVAVGFLNSTGAIGTASSRIMIVLQGRTTVQLYQPSGITSVATIPALADGWHKFGMLVRTGSGNTTAAIFIDGVEVTRATISWAATDYRLGCGAYGTMTARFRNLRGWNVPDVRDFTFPT